MGFIFNCYYINSVYNKWFFCTNRTNIWLKYSSLPVTAWKVVYSLFDVSSLLNFCIPSWRGTRRNRVARIFTRRITQKIQSWKNQSYHRSFLGDLAYSALVYAMGWAFIHPVYWICLNDDINFICLLLYLRKITREYAHYDSVSWKL